MVRLKLPAAAEVAQPVPRIKLRVSADAKRQLAGSVLRLPLENGVGEGLLPLSQGSSVAESLSPRKLEECGLSAGAAAAMSAVLQRGLGDWIWNGHVTFCNFATLSSLEERLVEAVYPIASIGADQRVHYSIRLGEVELMSVTVGVPPDDFSLGAEGLLPGVAVVAANDHAVMAVCEVHDDGTVRVQSEKGVERVLRSQELQPVITRKARDRVVVLKGKYCRLAGKLILASEELVQLQLDGDASGLVVVPIRWTAKRRELMSEEQRSTMAQLDQVVSSLSAPSPPPPPPLPVRASKKGRPIKEKKPDPDAYVEKKRVKKQPKKEAPVAVSATEVTGATVPLVASVAPVAGVPDDNPVPMRGSPPEWLLQKWQGAILVKVQSYPTWPCRIGSTLDLHRFPAASQVPAAQKEAFVFFFGDKTVSWVRFSALQPWPEGSAEKQAEELAKISVSKKHAKLWKLAFDEAVEWNRNVGLLPHTLPQIEQAAPPPQQKRAKKASGQQKRAKKASAKRAGGVAEAAPEVEWLETLVCSKCRSPEREDVILMCDGALCTTALHTYCCEPPLTRVPAGSWFCPLHDGVDRAVCDACKGGENKDLIILCDVRDCEAGYHLYCMKPALPHVPTGEWFCPAHEGLRPLPPRSAYTLFTLDTLDELRREHPNADGEELAVLLAQRWEAGGNEGKTRYAFRSANERYVYERSRGLGPTPPLEPAPKRRAVNEEPEFDAKTFP
jgi:hypothetical protein